MPSYSCNRHPLKLCMHRFGEKKTRFKSGSFKIGSFGSYPFDLFKCSLQFIAPLYHIWSSTFSEFGKWCHYLCIIWNATSVEIYNSQQTSTCFLCFWSVSVQHSTNSFYSFSLWSSCVILKGMPKKINLSKANFTFC